MAEQISDIGKSITERIEAINFTLKFDLKKEYKLAELCDQVQRVNLNKLIFIRLVDENFHMKPGEVSYIYLYTDIRTNMVYNYTCYDHLDALSRCINISYPVKSQIPIISFKTKDKILKNTTCPRREISKDGDTQKLIKGFDKYLLNSIFAPIVLKTVEIKYND